MMRRYVFVSVLVAIIAFAGVGGAYAAKGGDNACPPKSPGFPNPDPPNCGKKAPVPPPPPPPPPPLPPPPCEGTLAADVYDSTREVPVAGDVIVPPDGEGDVSTPVDEAVTGLTNEELGNEAGCAVSLTGL